MENAIFPLKITRDDVTKNAIFSKSSLQVPLNFVWRWIDSEYGTVSFARISALVFKLLRNFLSGRGGGR